MRRAGWAAICCVINGAIAACAVSFPDYPETQGVASSNSSSTSASTTSVSSGAGGEAPDSGDGGDGGGDAPCYTCSTAVFIVANGDAGDPGVPLCARSVELFGKLSECICTACQPCAGYCQLEVKPLPPDSGCFSCAAVAVSDAGQCFVRGQDCAADK